MQYEQGSANCILQTKCYLTLLSVNNILSEPEYIHLFTTMYLFIYCLWLLFQAIIWKFSSFVKNQSTQTLKYLASCFFFTKIIIPAIKFNQLLNTKWLWTTNKMKLYINIKLSKRKILRIHSVDKVLTACDG